MTRIFGAIGGYSVLSLFQMMLAAIASPSEPAAVFKFDGNLQNDISGNRVTLAAKGQEKYSEGLDGLALNFSPDRPNSHAILNPGSLDLNSDSSFTVLFWVRSSASSDAKTVLVSRKDMPDNSLASQKAAGWSFSMMHGTWAWNIGSGGRRLNYQRHNGERMPLNDGRWHQLAMAYDSASSQIQLYYDGVNWVTYNVRDSSGFSFDSESPLMLGQPKTDRQSDLDERLISEGRDSLQAFVDSYYTLGLPQLLPEELVPLIVDPKRRTERNAADAGVALTEEQVDSIDSRAASLMRNPYTVHQSIDFMEVALLPKVYRLEGTEIKINRDAARALIADSQLHDSDFDLDGLTIWDRSVASDEIAAGYERRFPTKQRPLKRSIDTVVAGAFNIYHGGLHQNIGQHGWDSRDTIAQVIRRSQVDLVMMQETYSAGDYIAAELGYYFATTVDWDYLNQGANISVLSRYPIKSIAIPPTSAFMNVSALVSLSETQDIYVMSNWYGMQNFPDVYEFHENRFAGTDTVPVLFGGDFNAVPPTDGGTNQAYDMLTSNGFVDAFRNMYPDFKTDPGFSHRSGRRIDQLYYKGRGLKNTSTTVVSTWPSLFPSDHYLIRSVFEIDFQTKVR